MNVAAKLTGFLVALAAVFGVAFLTGTQSSALLAPPPEPHANSLGGLTAAADGYTLAAAPALDPGPDQSVALTLTGPDGGPVGALTDVLGAPAHLVAIRRDLAGFQHVTPERGNGASSWRARLDLTPGPWRLMLEVQPEALGRPVTLGVDVAVRGPYRPAAPPPRTDLVTAGGLEARLSDGPSVGSAAPTVVTVSAGGEPVRDLQPIHGAPAHAVVIRPGDLGFAHLHAPAGAPGGPRVEFEGGVPEPGAYTVFVELVRGGQRHVAAYTVEVRS